MNPKEQYPNDKLQKSSIIFLQLGLILAMLFVYGVLESQFEQKKLVDRYPDEAIETPMIYPMVPNVIIIEQPPKPKEIIELPKVKEPTDKIKISENNPLFTETPVAPTEPPSKVNITKAIGDLPDITEDTPDEPVQFIFLEEAPVFPGCEGLNEEEAKVCFTKQISKFVNRRFNTGLGEELGLQGTQKIFVQFIITPQGTIDVIKTKAPHKRLEKEALRVIKKLPKMTPGMQRKRPVPVKYTLPISFEIH